jgi:hypothetical protein
MVSSSLAACVARAAPAAGRGRRHVVSSWATARCRGVTVNANASTSAPPAEEPTPGASLRAVLGADDEAWKHIMSSPEGRAMVEMSPRALTMRLLALRDALFAVSRTHDLDIVGMVIEQPSLATFQGECGVSIERAWRVLETTFGEDVDLASKAHACPCAFAHVLRRSLDLDRERSGNADARAEDAAGTLAGVAGKALEKRLGASLRGWLNGKDWFCVFSSCVGSEWGYSRTMRACGEVKTLQGTTLESFRRGSAYRSKNARARLATRRVVPPPPVSRAS